jgi:hypothetical protein
MWMPTDQINRYRSRSPLVGEVEQNFRVKKDRKRVEGIDSKSQNRREHEERELCRFEGEELDCYV